MSLLLGKEFGTERIAREALSLLAVNLNTALDVEDAKWTTLDNTLSATLDQPYYQCISDYVQPENFYMGHRPSLVEAPIENYPNISVMSYSATPSGDQGDYYEGFNITFFVEAMVIDGPYDSKITGFERQAEDLINRKAQRMAESIHNVLVSHPTLNGVVGAIGTVPRLIISEAFRRREMQGGIGNDYYWQMIRLEYTAQKIASAPY